MLAPWKKSYDQPRQHIKNRDITLPTKVCLVKAMVFPVVMYGCESWTIKKTDHRRIDAFELWCWRRLLRVPCCKEIQPVHPKGGQSWVFFGRTDIEAETPILWPPDAKSWLIWKDPDVGKDWGQEEKRTTEDEMVGWHHQLNGHSLGRSRSWWWTGIAKTRTRLSDWTEPSPSLFSSAGMAFWGVFAMSTIQVLKRKPCLTPGFTMYCPYYLGQVSNSSEPYLWSLKTPQVGWWIPILASSSHSQIKGIKSGLTGRTHSPGLCSDIPRYSGSAGHSPPEAERSDKGSMQRDLRTARTTASFAWPPNPPALQGRAFQPQHLCGLHSQLTASHLRTPPVSAAPSRKLPGPAAI